MSTDRELKRKLCSMFGASVLATTLAAVPLSFDPDRLVVTQPQAFAEGGDGGGEGGDGGDGDGGEGGDGDGDGDSGGESGGGGESGNSGSGGSGENSGSGSGENSGSSGQSGESGKVRNKFRHSTSNAIPGRFGRVVRTRRSSRGIEVRYSDGWRERIRDGRYQLTNPKNITIISRKVRNSDYRRLEKTAN